MKQIKNTIVLIADRITSFGDVTIHSDNLELIEESYFNSISLALEKIAKKVIYYSTPKEFISCIHKHKNDIVFPIWSGQRSRNRRALIPSICEAYGIRYIGADTYANIICQDKAMSKEFVRKLGISVPNGRILSPWSNNLDISNLNLPLVVKPNFEGGSMGISEKSLCHSHASALSLARELSNHFSQEALIEEFIEGREISIVLSGNSKKIKLAEAVELVMNNGESLSKRLYSYEIKKVSDGVFNKLITNDLPIQIINNAKQVFKQLGKVENLRFDGRFNGSDFYLIELSPDIHFGEGSTFSYAFQETGISYEEMLSIMVQNVESN